MKQILLVDDHQMLREGMERALIRTKFRCQIFHASNGKEALQHPNLSKFDLIFMDVNMPVMDGVETTKQILRRHSHLKIIGLSQYEDKQTISLMYHAGALGYLFKSNGDKDLLTAMYEVMNGNTYFPGDVTNTFGVKKDLSPFQQKLSAKSISLTDREEEILLLIYHGFSSSRIAEKISLSQRTVDWHRKHLLEKTGCKTSLEMVAFLKDLGL